MPRRSLAGRRIVFVFNWSEFGGAERKALFLARHLREAEGAEVAVLALTTREGRATETARELGLAWHAVRVDWSGRRGEKARELVRLASALRALRPDVVLPQCTVPNTLAGLVWRATGARLCVLNQCDVGGSRRIGPRLIGRALALAPLTVSCAHHARRVLIERYGARPERVCVVYGEVSIPPAREPGAAWRARLAVGRDELAVGMLANFHEGKDHATLLRAWRAVLDGRPAGAPSVRLVLAGRAAGTEAEAKALAYDLELGRSVRFAGDVADVAGLLDALDVAVLSSPSECLGRGALEAMAAGLPVAGTDVPGIREALGLPGADLLAPKGDVGALADVLGRLLADAELRRRVGAANVERIRAEFGAERTTERYVELLAEGLAARG